MIQCSVLFFMIPDDEKHSICGRTHHTQANTNNIK
jgi:hypothetical protein